MIKRKLIFFLVLFFSSCVFSNPILNRFSAGLSLYFDNENISSKEIHNFILVDFSYEILFSPIRFCNFSTELVFETNPFINNYSFSINLKEYLKDDFSGFFVGISPVSKINIGNLSANNGYLNYGLGFSFGFNKRINNKFHFETEGIITFCLYDKNNTMKVDLSTSIQYLLF
ncbi:MAG: hypothetical protein J6C25_10265 [Treponema sp.]|nr:hypothetical protein [Treponema sp.]